MQNISKREMIERKIKIGSGLTPESDKRLPNLAAPPLDLWGDASISKVWVCWGGCACLCVPEGVDTGKKPYRN